MFGGNNESITTTFVAKDQMTPVVKGIRSTMDSFKKDAMKGFGIGAGLSVWSGITKAIDFAGDSLSAYASDQASVARLTTAIKENSKAWGGNMKAVEDVIASRTQLGFADDDQRASLAETVASVGDLNDALAIQRTAMDLARLKNMSLGDAAKVLTKAYLGSTTALQKMGIKIKKGADGMDAIAAVQERAAGQAKAYSETLVGSAEVMAISFDEFKESVGGALNNALGPFFKLVVDLTNQTPDLDTTLGKLTQSYRDLIQVKADAIQQDASWDDEITGMLQGVFMPQDKAIHDFTGTLGDYQRILGVSRKELALFTEAGLTAGMSLDSLRETLDRLVASQVEERAKSIGYAWQTGMTEVSAAAADYKIAVRSLAPATTHAVVNMKQAIKQGKAGIVEQFRDLAWQSKHPFATVNYEAWLERKQRKATRLMKQAVKDGRPDVVEQYRQMIQDIHAELSGLPGYTAGIAADAMAQLAAIGPAVTAAMGGSSGGGDSKGRHWVKGHWKTDKNGANWVKGHWSKRAMGGPVDAGGTYLVGENGPEVLQMGNRHGSITPNHKLGGSGPIVVNVDGRRLFEIMDARNGRAIAMGG